MAGSGAQVTARIAVRRPSAGVLVAVLVASAFVAAVVSAVALLRVQEHDRTAVARTDAAQQSARRLVLAMTTQNNATLKQQVATVTSLSTGQFRDQFKAQKPSYVEAVTKAGVTSVGRIAAIAVASSSDSQVVVLVAVSSTVANTKVPQGEQRAYRMKLTMVPRDGRWLTSKLELVA